MAHSNFAISSLLYTMLFLFHCTLPLIKAYFYYFLAPPHCLYPPANTFCYTVCKDSFSPWKCTTELAVA